MPAGHLPLFCLEKTAACHGIGVDPLETCGTKRVTRNLPGGGNRVGASWASGGKPEDRGAWYCIAGPDKRGSLVNGVEVDMTIAGKSFSKTAIGQTIAKVNRLDAVQAEGGTPPLAATLDCMFLVDPKAQIATPKGEMPAGRLMPGDLISTRSHGDQPLLGIVPVTLSRDMLIAAPRLTPVFLAAGSLGHGLPLRSLQVPPSSRIAGLDGATHMGPVPVTDVVGRHGIARIFPDGASYLRLVLPVSALMMVEGVWYAPNQVADDTTADISLSWPISSWQKLAAVAQTLVRQSQIQDR